MLTRGARTRDRQSATRRLQPTSPNRKPDSSGGVKPPAGMCEGPCVLSHTCISMVHIAQRAADTSTCNSHGPHDEMMPGQTAVDGRWDLRWHFPWMPHALCHSPPLTPTSKALAQTICAPCWQNLVPWPKVPGSELKVHVPAHQDSPTGYEYPLATRLFHHFGRVLEPCHPARLLPTLIGPCWLRLKKATT